MSTVSTKTTEEREEKGNAVNATVISRCLALRCAVVLHHNGERPVFISVALSLSKRKTRYSKLRPKQKKKDKQKLRQHGVIQKQEPEHERTKKTNKQQNWKRNNHQCRGALLLFFFLVLPAVIQPETAKKRTSQPTHKNRIGTSAFGFSPLASATNQRKQSADVVTPAPNWR